MAPPGPPPAPAPAPPRSPRCHRPPRRRPRYRTPAAAESEDPGARPYGRQRSARESLRGHRQGRLDDRPFSRPAADDKRANQLSDALAHQPNFNALARSVGIRLDTSTTIANPALRADAVPVPPQPYALGLRV